MAKEVNNAKCICISMSTYVYLSPLSPVKEHLCIYPTWVYVYEYVTRTPNKQPDIDGVNEKHVLS